MKTGEQLKLEGMLQASQHAEEVSTNWNDKALSLLKQFSKHEFMAEELREWAHKTGLPMPPSARAWGAVIVTARKQGLIKHAGYRNVENPKAHRTPASVWIKVK